MSISVNRRRVAVDRCGAKVALLLMSLSIRAKQKRPSLGKSDPQKLRIEKRFTLDNPLST